LCHVFQFLHGFSDAAASVPVFACTPDLFPELMGCGYFQKGFEAMGGGAGGGAEGVAPTTSPHIVYFTSI